MSDLLTDPFDAWLAALLDRHMRALSRPEFLKAVRALSVRYVERRGEITRRSPTDSPGKRAAFSGFFTPLHFLTTRAIVRSLGAGSPAISTIVDLGCGTGAASAAWALEMAPTPMITGVDRQSWVLDEARWNWSCLHLQGRPRRANLVDATLTIPRENSRQSREKTGIVIGWSVNELGEQDRRRLIERVALLIERGAAVLVIEPLARAVSPWWDEWARRLLPLGGRADEWKFPVALPPALAALDEAAGFRREHLGARSLYVCLPARSVPQR